MLKLKDYDLYIFDMDDTLFLESDYVLSGFKFISSYLAQKNQMSADVFFDFFECQFKKEGRDKIFDLALSYFNIPFEQSNIDELVGIYRNHSPSISLKPEIKSGLKQLRKRGKKMAIVTDGLTVMQENKVKALGLEQLVDQVVYCHKIGFPKPGVEGFKLSCNTFNVSKLRCIIIGDDPVCDIQPACKLGIKSIRIRSGRFCKQEDLPQYLSSNQYPNLEQFFEELIREFEQ